MLEPVSLQGFLSISKGLLNRETGMVFVPLACRWRAVCGLVLGVDGGKGKYRGMMGTGDGNALLPHFNL